MKRPIAAAIVVCTAFLHLPSANAETQAILEEACEVYAAVEQYLQTAKPRMDKAVGPLDPPHIDSFGDIRMGSWLLEGPDDDGELRLACYIAVTQFHRVRQEIRIVRAEDGAWKAVSTGEVIYHMQR